MWPFICTNLNPLHLRMLCAAFCWNWAIGSGRYWEFVNGLFAYFLIIFPCKKAWPIFWTKSIFFLHKVDLCQVGWKLGQWFWRRFLKFFMEFSLFVIISSLKIPWPLIWKKTNLNSLYPRVQRCFVQCLVEMSHVLLEKKMKIKKKIKTTTTTTDNGRILIRKVHFSIWLRWGKDEIIGI